MKVIQKIKDKIAIKLSLYFAVILVIFSIVVGSFFIVIFKQHTVEVHKNQLLEHANAISDTLSEFMDKGSGQYGMRGMGGYGAYLKFIYDIAGTNVWVINRDYSIVTSGMRQGENNKKIDYENLPETVKPLISKVFNGETKWSQGFSQILSEMNLTVGTPIKSSTGEILGIVLLHDSMDDMNESLLSGIKVMAVSMLIGIFIVTIMAIGFSFSFTKPLRRMKGIALRLAEGNYQLQETRYSNDEIGQLEQTLEVLAKRLELAQGEQERLDKLRNDFVANISHELKTPITVVRGSLEALVDGVVTQPEQVDSYHKQMLFETIFLQRLVTDLLDLSKLQNMDFKIEKQNISLKELLQDLLRSGMQLARKKEVIIEDMYSGSEDIVIYGDYGRLRQMLMIILDNAVKFSPSGEKVEIKLAGEKLIIRDYGQGISREELPYIFEKFYKSHSENNKSGTGLGLAIAYQIAKRHNITIEVESETGKGTAFILSLT